MNKTKNRKSTKIMALISLGLVLLLVAGIYADHAEITKSTEAPVTSESDPRMVPGVLDKDSIVEPPGIPARPQKVSVKIAPERQIAELVNEDEAYATYSVVVKDMHLLSLQPCKVGEDCKYPTFEYKLSFEAREIGTWGEFEEDTIYLEPGTSKTVELKVGTKNKGASAFTVKVSRNLEAAYAKGIIVFSENQIPPTEKSFFNGPGFILSEDKLEGFTIDMVLLSDGETGLIGKIRIDKRNFKIQGSRSGEDLELKFISVESSDGIAVPIVFSGSLKKYGDFSLLEGELHYFKGKTWILTATSRNIGFITSVDVTEGKVTTPTMVKGVIVVQGDSETEEVFFKPVRIREKKILWVIPTGKKAVDLEVIIGDRVFTKKITEYNAVEIEGYSISVGSLVDEDNIEITVERKR